MIRRIQALNYRCLRYVDVHLDGSFHILVGPNASGKSTFLDVVAFLGDLVSDGLSAAVGRRTENFEDLVWDRQRENPRFELAVEFDVPEELRPKLAVQDDDRPSPCFFRYEVAIRAGDDGPCIASEAGFLKSCRAKTRGRLHSSEKDPFEWSPPRSFRPTAPVPESILSAADISRCHLSLQKSMEGRDIFKSETASWPEYSSTSELTVALGPRRSALKNLPESPEQFPVASYAKRILEAGVRKLFLNSRCLRHASLPSNRCLTIGPDGSNLPWAIQQLREVSPEKFCAWLDHVRTAIREVEDIRLVERADGLHMVLVHTSGEEAPSWAVSDGALRLLALTLTAYLPDRGKIYLVEEPENGIHPMAIETVYQSLASVYDSQVFVATHSPVFLSCAEPEEILCFAKNEEGATDITSGEQHPRLASWRSSADINVLFASEVLS